jgi:hypothetical protein
MWATLKRTYPQAEVFNGPLALLVEDGYLRCDPPEAAGRPRAWYVVDPHWDRTAG